MVTRRPIGARSRDRGFSRGFLLRALFLAAVAGLGGCYDRKQTATLNPDGSGKMIIETEVAVPATDARGGRGAKQNALEFGRQLAARFVNNTIGIDAWSDVSITEAPNGRVLIKITAYFPDINKVRFADMPLEFQWTRAQPGREGDPETHVFSIHRTRTKADQAKLNEDQIKALVAQAQQQYKDQKLALRAQLSAFSLSVKFSLPGEPVDSRLFTSDKNIVSISLDGKKVADAIDKFMADGEALAATLRAGVDLTSNDDYILKAMYQQAGPVVARMKTADALPSFDYKREAFAAQSVQSAMFAEAGVQLLGTFTVKPATQPGK